jgi:HEAT repeat protein
MFNMGGTPLSLPEAMGLMQDSQSSVLQDALTIFQNGTEASEEPGDPLGKMVRKTMEEMAWKFGVMFADARDARQDRVKRLVELLTSGAALTRAAAALSLPWYGEERSLEPLSRLAHDPDETVVRTAAWARDALQKVISYRNHSGM